MANRNRAVDRALARSASRPLQRAEHDHGPTAERLGERADGARLTRSPGDVQFAAREASGGGAASSPDLRNEIARQLAELVNLSAERGIARAPNEIHRAEEFTPAKDDDDGAGVVFDEWVEELRASGMPEPEIEDHIAARLRGLRRAMLAEAASRSVGRR